jgi:hypothetical protein
MAPQVKLAAFVEIGPAGLHASVYECRGQSTLLAAFDLARAGSSHY